MNKYYLLLYFFILSILSCSKNNTKDIQDEIFNDIFNELISNATMDYRKTVFPSPEQLELWKMGRDTLKKDILDSRKMLVIINDSIRMPKISKEQNINTESHDLNALVKFNFDDFKYADDFHLVSNNEYSKNSKTLLEEFYFGGFLDISNIVIKENLNEAYMLVNYRFGKLISQKNKIHIKKTDGKWRIIRAELINIS